MKQKSKATLRAFDLLPRERNKADMLKNPPPDRIRSIDAPIGRKWHIDLHGYRPREIVGACLAAIVQQVWETGADRIRFIHGHGRVRGKTPGFVNTKTGYFGLRIRRQLRRNRALRQWIKYTTLDCGEWGATTVGLKTNANPTRTEIDPRVFPQSSYDPQLSLDKTWKHGDGRRVVVSMTNG